MEMSCPQRAGSPTPRPSLKRQGLLHSRLEGEAVGVGHRHHVKPTDVPRYPHRGYVGCHHRHLRPETGASLDLGLPPTFTGSAPREGTWLVQMTPTAASPGEEPWESLERSPGVRAALISPAGEVTTAACQSRAPARLAAGPKGQATLKVCVQLLVNKRGVTA